jgi:hypothetical protein
MANLQEFWLKTLNPLQPDYQNTTLFLIMISTLEHFDFSIFHPVYEPVF